MLFANETYPLTFSLAYAELNIALGILFGPNGPTMSLFETDEVDVKPAADLVNAAPKLGSRGIRIMVH